jgi:hypothetical protein
MEVTVTFVAWWGGLTPTRPRRGPASNQICHHPHIAPALPTHNTCAIVAQILLPPPSPHSRLPSIILCSTSPPVLLSSMCPSILLHSQAARLPPPRADLLRPRPLPGSPRLLHAGAQSPPHRALAWPEFSTPCPGWLQLPACGHARLTHRQTVPPSTTSV